MNPLSTVTRPFSMSTEAQTHAPSASHIVWPEPYRPERSAIFVHNEIVISAEPAAIWRVLARAEEWPEWYPNSADIHFLSHAGPDLRDRSRFRWKTFGVRITSKVLEFEPERRIAWDAHGIGLRGYHSWLLTPLDGGRTLVVTEETQNGWLARLANSLFPARMERMHQLWLEELGHRVRSAG